ncbi:MAG: pseudouridine-5'-phosphate glycosidase [Ascidiaceihabitans sp.]|uniref:pseudouridine-5'-phosphate glycosidase n=1 Tax=Ascidiaceihabitans sp. TaxID=1872644 RepID=UPI003297763D
MEDLFSSLHQEFGEKDVVRIDVSRLAHSMVTSETGGFKVGALSHLLDQPHRSLILCDFIGGVSSVSPINLDISSDILQLSRKGVTGCCYSLPKIYDLQKTLEYCETLGIPVWSLGGPDLDDFFGGAHSAWRGGGKLLRSQELSLQRSTASSIGLSTSSLILHGLETEWVGGVNEHSVLSESELRSLRERLIASEESDFWLKHLDHEGTNGLLISQRSRTLLHFEHVIGWLSR